MKIKNQSSKLSPRPSHHRAMSIRLAGAKSPPLTSLIRRSTAEISPLSIFHSRGLRLEFCSSSYSYSSTESEKPEKKSLDRLSAAIDAVKDRNLPPELRGQRDSVRSETDIINVVERRIFNSMLDGQFENLPGKGKPLNLDTNPHTDPAENTLYRILSRNNCAPEWVELNKEIRSRVAEWRLGLRKARTCISNGDESEWGERAAALKRQLRDINDMVFRYNLIVPFGRQMFGLKWEKELDRLEEH